jgi:E3 ubiquitin-protein ligase BRE1
LEEKRVLEEKLEAFTPSSEDGREKALIIASEKKARGQVEELRRKCEDLRRDYEKRKEHLKEESTRRCKALAEDNKQLQRELVAKRQEAQALVQEMECTAEAFEEVQEQNVRLLDQIREKDDANFKVISERIKASSMQKLLMEEKDLLHSQISNLTQEKNRLYLYSHTSLFHSSLHPLRMSEVMARLEERDKHQEASLVAMEKDLALKQQAMETLKKKAQESVQTSQSLQLAVAGEEREKESHREKLRQRQEERERAAQQLRRSQEEVASLKRKLEKYKSRDWASSSDEVLLEEIRTYKVKLNCPCCSTRKKDTVLTKCFHVFCSECIRSRYDSRLRKCPKCGAAFGANDFHKLYLS